MTHKIIALLLLFAMAGCGPRAQILRKYPVNMEYIARGENCSQDSIYAVLVDGAGQKRLKVVYDDNTCPDFQPIWSAR